MLLPLSAGDVSRKSAFICFAASPCAQLSGALSTPQRIRLPRQRLPFQEMFHSSSILRSFPLRAETTVDLSGSSMLPFLNVPCSLTPPQSPVTIASCGDLLLPSSQYDAVGLRVTTITRLNRFTCVTARSSLVPTLNSCRCLHEPKARFPVGRLIPLSEAGILPGGSIRVFLPRHIRGAIRRGRGGKEYALPSLPFAIGAHPSPRPSARASHYSSE